MRCSAPVLKAQMIELRASRDPDPRCQRNAKVFLWGPFGMRQHGFCRPHAKIWKRHYEIVERILSL